MSYNIGNSRIIGGRGVTLTGRQIMAFLRELDLPEDNMLFEHAKDRLDPDADYPVDGSWGGESSGATYNTLLLATILPATKGNVEIVYTWEGGDSFSGVRVVNGRVTKHSVQMWLGEVVP